MYIHNFLHQILQYQQENKNSRTDKTEKTGQQQQQHPSLRGGGGGVVWWRPVEGKEGGSQCEEGRNALLPGKGKLEGN